MNAVRKAIENLPGHWYKGGLMDGDGNFCGLGHVSNALAEETSQNARYVDMVYKMMSEVAKEMYPDRINAYVDEAGMCAFPSFNDHNDTTESDVLAVLEKVAIKLDERVE